MNNNIKLFDKDIKKTIIFHIPHTSMFLPKYIGYDNFKLVQSEMNLVTDFNIDEIFKVKGIKQIKANFSRVFCDVERLEDDKEKLSKVGRGFFYTKTDEGKLLRKEDKLIKEFVYKNYYLKHHLKLQQVVEKKLKENDVVYIIDCHSFNDIPLNTDLNKKTPRPDICLGVDKFHTPSFLTNYIKQSFEKNNYSVNINSPYAGTIVPLKFFEKNKRVNSIMIEINKRLYLTDNKAKDIKKLNSIIKEIFNFY